AATLFHRPSHPYTRGLIASRPQIDPAAAIAGERLRGLLRRDQLPPGCPFAPRCGFAEPSCATNRQVLEAVGPGQWVACQRWRELPEPEHRAAAPRSGMAGQAEAPLLALENLTLSYGPLRRLG